MSMFVGCFLEIFAIYMRRNRFDAASSVIRFVIYVSHNYVSTVDIFRDVSLLLHLQFVYFNKLSTSNNFFRVNTKIMLFV